MRVFNCQVCGNEIFLDPESSKEIEPVCCKQPMVEVDAD